MKTSTNNQKNNNFPKEIGIFSTTNLAVCRSRFGSLAQCVAAAARANLRPRQKEWGSYKARGNHGSLSRGAAGQTPASDPTAD